MSWVQIGQDINGENSGDFSGESISINSNGTIVAIGARNNDSNGVNSGHVRVYEYDNSVWNQLGQDIDGENNGDLSGSSVSINSDGTRIVIGASNNNSNGTNSGHVRVYEYNGSIWNQLGQDIDGENNGDLSGSSVSINADGTIVAIGASNNDSNGTNSRQVRVYEYDNSVWNQIGQDINGENNGDVSGSSVSINADGTIVAIGASNNDSNGTNSGHVRIYEYDGSSWVQLGQDIDGENTFDQSGISVSINSNGTRVAIGAKFNDGNGSNSGHVRIYEYDNINWIQLGQDIDGENAFDQSGSSVSINTDGTIVAIGATNNEDSGHVRIYEYDNSVWVQLGQDINGENTHDQNGSSISLSNDGTRIAISAIYNGDNGVNSGSVRIFEFPPKTFNDAEEKEQTLLNIPEQNLSIIGQCSKIPISQYPSQKTIEDINNFKFVKIKLNNKIAIYNINTLEEVQNESNDIEIYTKNNNSNELLKECNLIQINNDINGSLIKCLEKFILLQISNNKIIKIKLNRNNKIVPCKNSILVIDTNDNTINTIYFS